MVAPPHTQRLARAVAPVAVCALLLTSCLDGPLGPVFPGSPADVSGGLVGAPGPHSDSRVARLVSPVDDDPDQLLGLDAEALRALLGKPGFVRRDDPARMWRYRHAGCVLDLFLYAETGAPVPSARVRHVEARAHDLETASTRACLRALLVDRAASSTG